MPLAAIGIALTKVFVADADGVRLERAVHVWSQPRFTKGFLGLPGYL
jgi:hypothetical protein